MSTSEGHRERLRNRFVESPETLSEVEILELLLTYAIPRRDVAPLAESLLSSFGSLQAVVQASLDDLLAVDGIGQSTAILIKLLGMAGEMPKGNVILPQLKLFDLNTEEKPKEFHKAPKERTMRVFTNDEVANSLELLPEAPKYKTFGAFKQILNEKLPYNAAKTRLRRANHILDRFFPSGSLEVDLTYFLAQYSTQADLKPVIFYHILQAEPIAAKVAEEFVWPALPLGRVEREPMREFVLRYLPDAGESSQKNMLRALFYTYDLLGIGSANDTALRFQLHKGTLESFLYILTCEFPKPGIYSYEDLYAGPLHHWMLWDREWMRQQLYNLQDFGILTKVSEIDTVKQFTLAVDQPKALHLFFEHPERNTRAIRERKESRASDQEK